MSGGTAPIIPEYSQLGKQCIERSGRVPTGCESLWWTSSKSSSWREPDGHRFLIRISKPCSSCSARLRTDLSPTVSWASFWITAYSAWDYGHRGTRHMSISPSVHTRSANPLAIVGVRVRHCLAEPMPTVGSNAARDTHRELRNKKK